MDSPPKQSKRLPSSPPPMSSETISRQPKSPRLDPATSTTTATAQSDTQPSGVGQFPTTDPQDSSATGAVSDSDMKILKFSEYHFRAGNFGGALAIIVFLDVIHHRPGSVFTGCGWSDITGAEKAIADDPELEGLIRGCFEKGTLEPLRRKVKSSTPGHGSSIVKDMSAVRGVVKKAWEVNYEGNSSSLLVEALHTMNSKRTLKEYSNFVPVVQSSGMGKSRTVDEAAKMIFTLPFNLRSDDDTTAYPPPHKEIRDFFNVANPKGFSKDQLEYRYLHFFKQLFDIVNAEVSKVMICETYSKLASTWHSNFSKTAQNELYHEAVEKALDELNTKPFVEDALDDSRTAVKTSAQKLIATIDAKSALSGSDRTGGRGQHKRPVKMMLYFDESHELVYKFTKADKDNEARSPYQVLCKSLNSVMQEDIFVVHLSTNCNLSRYSPHQGRFWSHRGDPAGPVQGDDLQAPFVELPFDVFAAVEEGKIDLTNVSQLKHIGKFGRPLFNTMLEAGHTDIVAFAVQKLYGHPREENENGRLAALSIRLLFEFEPLRELAKDKEVELVAGHMRVAYSVPQHRLYIRSGTPSEPLLAEASARIMAKSDPLTLLQGFLRRGLISKGKRGELVGRLILTLAHDKAIKAGQKRFFSEPVGVIGFLEALIGTNYIDSVKKSKPANVADGQTLEEAFANAQINFTHFVKGGDSSIVSDEITWMALARCMAFACADDQRTIDLYIPVLLWEEKLSRWAVSGIFIQFKTRASQERVIIDAAKLGFFTHADPAGARAERYNTRPYITIVMNMGVREKVSAQPEEAKSRTPPMSTTQTSLANLKTTPSQVTTEAGPTRAQPKRGGGATNVHPRYAINITGCSSNVYGVFLSDSTKVLEGMLSVHDILDEHPRTEESFLNAARRLKPFWAKGESSFHWATGMNKDEVVDEDEGVFVGHDDDDDDDDMVAD